MHAKAVVGNLAATKAVSELPPSTCFGAKPAWMCFSQVECRLLTAFLLVPVIFQPDKGHHVPCVGPQDLCSQSVALATHSHGQISDHVFSLFLWVPSQGLRSQPDCLPFLPNYMFIFLTALIVQKSSCQFPFSFQWELFQMYIYFWCVHGGTWIPHPPTPPSWSIYQ